jgi:hypothetical protein
MDRLLSALLIEIDGLSSLVLLLEYPRAPRTPVPFPSTFKCPSTSLCACK